jgi:hypothetical protein
MEALKMVYNNFAVLAKVLLDRAWMDFQCFEWLDGFAISLPFVRERERTSAS